jgi:hypothetical protein
MPDSGQPVRFNEQCDGPLLEKQKSFYTTKGKANIYRQQQQQKDQRLCNLMITKAIWRQMPANILLTVFLVSLLGSTN